MFGSDAGSRFALKLRRLRGRFGVATPRVAIRTHLPWYWRALSVVLLAGVSIALAGWIYSAGLRFAGFHQSLSEGETREMREQIVQLTAELDAARKVSNVSESRVRIESTAQERLSSQIKTLEEENARLKADLAMFENLAGGSPDVTGLTISRLHVEPTEAAGQYRYRVLLAQTGEKKEREFVGSIQFSVTVQRGKETVMMQFPAEGESSASSYKVVFRYFRRLEGILPVGQGARVVRVEARLIQEGVTKVSQSIVL